eukprot:426981-Rhodomonas_salina.1
MVATQHLFGFGEIHSAVAKSNSNSNSNRLAMRCYTTCSTAFVRYPGTRYEVETPGETPTPDTPWYGGSPRCAYPGTRLGAYSPPGTLRAFAGSEKLSSRYPGTPGTHGGANYTSTGQLFFLCCPPGSTTGCTGYVCFSGSNVQADH